MPCPKERILNTDNHSPVLFVQGGRGRRLLFDRPSCSHRVSGYVGERRQKGYVHVLGEKACDRTASSLAWRVRRKYSLGKRERTSGGLLIFEQPRFLLSLLVLMLKLKISFFSKKRAALFLLYKRDSLPFSRLVLALCGSATFILFSPLQGQSRRERPKNGEGTGVKHLTLKRPKLRSQISCVRDTGKTQKKEILYSSAQKNSFFPDNCSQFKQSERYGSKIRRASHHSSAFFSFATQ